MKFLFIYLAMVYVVACADDVKEPGDSHPKLNRIIRAAGWPLTLTSWFRTQNIRIHRTLNILWTLLIGSWFLSLIWDRL